MTTQSYALDSDYPINTKPLRIAVASNFAPILEKLLPEFSQQTQINVELISGSSGTLFVQIKHGAPFDVFLSADELRPQKLQDDKLIVANSLKTYAYGQLALYSHNDPNPSLANLAAYFADFPSQRFAIANPEIAPYGKAAKQVLEKLNLWQSVQSKLVIGVNINHTYMQIHSQSVNMGIVALSQLTLSQRSGTVIPQHYYQPIKQQLVILKASKQIENAQKLSEFLLSSSVQESLAAFGYGIDGSEFRNNTNGETK